MLGNGNQQNKNEGDSDSDDKDDEDGATPVAEGGPNAAGKGSAKRKVNQAYLLYAFFGCFCFASSGVLRKY